MVLEERADPANRERNLAFEAAHLAFTGEPVKIFGPNAYDAMTILSLSLYRSAKLYRNITRPLVLESIRAVANPDPNDRISNLVLLKENKPSMTDTPSIIKA